MKTKLFYCALIGMLALLMSASFERASAQGPAPRAPGAVMGTAFTYQGQIKKSGSPVTSTCTFAFGMWDAASGGTQLGSNQTVSGVSVSNGLFTTQLNGSGQFGANAFTGDARWLAISVQCTGDGSATSLGRQQLTPAPFALALPGLYTQQTGDTPNIIGGYSGNSVTSGGVGATIGGGGGSGWTNRVTDNFGTVGGGYNNRAGDNAGLTDNRPWATVSGGVNNVASGTAATIGGGYGNTTSGAGAFVGGGGYDGTATSGNTASGEASTIGGGRGNVADGGYTFVGGGVNNTASGRWGAIGGGAINTASGSYATVPGGVQITAAGYYSFAAGRRAKANHDGAFVWGDSTDADIASATTNQFVVRAANGAYVTSNFSGSAVYGYNNGGSGVKGETASIGAMGVYGLNNNTTSGYGVYGQGFRGVQGYTNSASGMGGFFMDMNLTASGTSVGMWAGSYYNDIIQGHELDASGNSLDRRFRVTYQGNVYADGTYSSPAADFAEMMPATTGLEAGDVLVIGLDGKLTRSTVAFASAVVGVYSTKPGFVGGSGDGIDPTGKIPLAVIGIVPVKVSAENGALQPGDLLVASSTPGHAMKAGSNPPVGTVIGKSLGVLPRGTGVIQMLVTLQ